MDVGLSQALKYMYDENVGIRSAFVEAFTIILHKDPQFDSLLETIHLVRYKRLVDVSESPVIQNIHRSYRSIYRYLRMNQITLVLRSFCVNRVQFQEWTLLLDVLQFAFRRKGRL